MHRCGLPKEIAKNKMKSLSEFIENKPEVNTQQVDPSGNVIGPDVLHKHFDVNGDGVVSMEDYASKVLYHQMHPEHLEHLRDRFDAKQKEHSDGVHDEHDPLLDMFKTNMSFIAKQSPDIEESVKRGKESHEEAKTPPAILVMRRKFIRNYPNGQKVAMYYVDKLDRYVTLPYSDLQWSPLSFKEENTQTKLEILDEIIFTSKSKEIVFEDGSSIEVNIKTAAEILDLFESADSGNRLVILDMLQSNRTQFTELADFAHKYLKE